MTTWRVTVEGHDGTGHDVVIDATEQATVADLRDELSSRGFSQGNLHFDGQPIGESVTLEESPLQHGSCISRRDREPDPISGWYLIAVAGPDTGVWILITQKGISVGRSSSCDLTVKDSALSRKHFNVKILNDAVMLEDLGSMNGTMLEGEPIEGQHQVTDGTYIGAGVTTFGVLRIYDSAVAPKSAKLGATVPFQRRFRDALNALPQSLKHPTPPSKKSNAGRRSVMSYIVPLLSTAGFGLMIGFSSGGGVGRRLAIMLPIMALGPLFIAIDSLRRRKSEAREETEQKAEYERRREGFLEYLERVRRDERDRDRWTATPAGIASLLTRIRHLRLWERSESDEDFCEVAIGLYSRPSNVKVEGRPADAAFDFDDHWAAVLRHSLIRDGPIAVVGPMARARALARSLLLDLATSHSPNDVKIWLVTDIEGTENSEWNEVKWLPHTFAGESQNYIFATSQHRAAALSTLRSIINERRGDNRREEITLPVHIVVFDCLHLVETEELADLLVGGAPVGVVGLVLDDLVTPEGTRAQLALGQLADEATFVSQTQPRADSVRSFEMSQKCFGSATRSMAAYRPASSSREVQGDSEVIRLVDLIDAEVDPRYAERVIERWSGGGTSRVRIGGLGDMVTEIDIMRDGPHGLVGGTTRSGKTEFLKSLITALAVGNHPNDLSIVIVDFKGGVDHELSALLPHVIDLSTNHNVDSFVRTVRLIEAELERRQREFKGVGAPNFDAYRAARQAKPSLLAIPRLLIIIDEFSELLSSESGKANLSSLESITRVGGGLGVHLLLVTQNFENQLPSQIAANAGLRICFRVQEANHSKAVLNSPEAATIPKERIGRAFLRSHGGRVVEFQAARVAGPRPGKEAVMSAVSVRMVPFSALADAPPQAPIVDVPAADTDMYAIVEVIRSAAARTGWTAPAVPWPKDLPRDLTIGDFEGAELDWPVGFLDEPERQRQSPIGLEVLGSHTLFLGGAEARLGDVLRAVVASGLIRRSPEKLHIYVIDQLGQGLSSLQVFPHTGGVAERNEPLAMRIMRLAATEVGRRKSRLSQLGMATIQELSASTGEDFPEIVLVVHGADRLLMHGEAQPSPILAPLLGLLSESVGTGVRVLMTGPSSVAHHRLGSSIGHRFVLMCPDPQEFSALGVHRSLYSGLDGFGRAVDVSSGHLMQFAIIPSTPEASATEIIRALGYRMTERWKETEDSPRLPIKVQDLLWPMPISQVISSASPSEVHQPVAMSINTETGEMAWLDADEDGPAFVVCGSPKSGRSNTLIASAMLMAQHGWEVLGLPLSRRSPVASGAFPGPVVRPEDLKAAGESRRPVALFIDDAHKWAGEVDGLQSLLDGPGPRAVVVAGPTEYFSGRSDLLRVLPSRCALVLAPQGGMDASQFGVRRLSDEVLRDTRPGRGILVVAGELMGAQVPLAI